MVTTWRVELKESARKELRKLSKKTQDRILRYLRSRIATAEDPRRQGKVLHGRFAGLWRYRVGDFRVLCRIEDKASTVRVLAIGDRKHVYH